MAHGSSFQGRFQSSNHQQRQSGEQNAHVSPVSLDDLREIKASLEGDGDAYGRLVRRYQGEIGRYMWRFSRDRAVCEELVQDVFVEAYVSLHSFRGRSPFGHWLRRIATRVGYRYWKSRADAAEHVDCVATLAAPASQLKPDEAAELLHAMLAQLSPRDRLVLTLMYLEEMPVAKVAELTGWTRTMVKVQAFRAKARLKKLLKKEHLS